MTETLSYTYLKGYDIAWADVKGGFILVAETDDALLGILKEDLATTDYAVLLVKDGKEAIFYLERLDSQIDLAIIDLDLPLVSGLDVIWSLVRKQKPKHTQIIATSAVHVPLLKTVVRRLGVDAVIQIPIPAESWHKLIAAFLCGELSRYSQAMDSGTVD